MVADSLRRDSFNHLLDMDGFKDYPVKQYEVESKNSSTELSLPWMLSSYPHYLPRESIPVELNKHGYNTLMIHSNPIVDRFKEGFDKSIDLHIHNRRMKLTRRYNHIRDALQKHLPEETYRKLKNMVRGPLENYLPYCRVEDKLVALKEHTPAPPYFIWLHLMDPHSPYYPQETALDLEKVVELNDNQISAVRGYYNPSLDETKTWYALYLAESMEMWRQLNTYLENVDYDETTVIFTSDHGEEFGEYGHYGHKGNRFTPENLTVPFFIAGETPKIEIKDHSQLRDLIINLV